jgi:predicted aldo/keto reductase-like oxidoreductase
VEYRVLGKTGLRISRLGFGGIPIQKIDAEGTKKLIGELVQEGVNFIDTARAYTVSEEYLGQALEGVRNRFVLATKSMARTKEAMEKDIAVSLKTLRTDFIDLYQVHNPNAKDLAQVTAPGGALEALLEAKAAGKIGHIGVTLHSVDLFRQAIEMPWVETIMFPYNIVETQGEELIARCAEKNIGFICMKPLAGGAIEDAAVALRFILQNPAVTVVIPGMADVAEITQNARVTNDTTPLTPVEKETITSIKELLGTNFCRRCNYCAPCTVGINLPAVFLFEGYYSRYDLKDWAQARYGQLEKKASDCIACGACEKRCPYDLPIREMLKKAAKTMEKPTSKQ